MMPIISRSCRSIGFFKFSKCLETLAVIVKSVSASNTNSSGFGSLLSLLQAVKAIPIPAISRDINIKFSFFIFCDFIKIKRLCKIRLLRCINKKIVTKMISQNAVKRFHPASFLPILPISSSKSSLLPSIPKIFNKRLFRMFEMYEGAHFLSLAISKGFTNHQTNIIFQIAQRMFLFPQYLRE